MSSDLSEPQDKPLAEKWCEESKRCRQIADECGAAEILARNIFDLIEQQLAAKDAEIARLRDDEYDQKAVAIIQNLSMLVRRLCHRHPNEKLVDQALGYLRGEGLQGSPLHAALAETPAAQPKRECICNKPENRGKYIKCPAHGSQRPDRTCPICKTHVIGTCPQGEYCTSEDCRYVS